MDDGAGQVNRIIAAIFIAIYGVAISLLAYFMFMWDNKGTKSIWDKSVTDWAVTIWLAVASPIVWFAVIKCASPKYIKSTFIYVLGVILSVHFLAVLSQAKNEAIYYLGAPHLFLGVGLYLWWRSVGHANSKP